MQVSSPTCPMSNDVQHMRVTNNCNDDHHEDGSYHVDYTKYYASGYYYDDYAEYYASCYYHEGCRKNVNDFCRNNFTNHYAHVTYRDYFESCGVHQA
ncbi:hypothetical protein NECAME_05064 [Necator americanus]|uniref:Uncharacterized protein n=1 Tax=Necator americanus TaxID=51031 RepID=W2SK10_NECAM|nr:hypothetical protein NECAME_05064 [Necator americanus]ETN69878.1 hypothetical protein NECAME_05064 [Necator americanus]